MAVLFIAYNQFENFLPTMQYEEKIPWLPGIGVTYHLGVDGPGLLMLMLSGLIGIASVSRPLTSAATRSATSVSVDEYCERAYAT